jgi:hypothetical protein
MYCTILTETQYRFHKNKPTILACQSFIRNAQKALERWAVAVGIFFDLNKAYDVIDHEIQTKTLWPLVRKRTIPTERPPLVGKI